MVFCLLLSLLRLIWNIFFLTLFVFSTPGYYCDQTGMVAVTARCAAGYFCSGNATMATPSLGASGNISPMGSFSLAGSVTATLCATGCLALMFTLVCICSSVQFIALRAYVLVH